MTEDQLQALIVKKYTNLYCLKSHNPRNLIMSIPNGGLRNKIEAMKMQATGLLAGATDLIVIHFGVIHFVELKKQGEKPRPNQLEFAERVKANGFNWHCFDNEIDFFLTFTNN
jgi:hypothetical protein